MSRLILRAKCRASPKISQSKSGRCRSGFTPRPGRSHRTFFSRRKAAPTVRRQFSSRCALSGLALHLAHKYAMTHGGGTGIRVVLMISLHDSHHGFEDSVSSPQALEAGRAVAVAVQETTEFGDDNHGLMQGEFFLDASSCRTSHSYGLKSKSHGSPGTVRPKSASSMIRQAITASIAMARSRTVASWF